MPFRDWISVSFTLLLGFCRALAAVANDEPSGTKVVQFGSMHEAIGQRHHQGRVRLGDLVKRPHFYGVAALKGLEGEVTVCAK